MPELPEVETIVRDIKCLEGQKVVKNIRLSSSGFQTSFGDLKDEVVERIERVSKHIIIKFKNSALLIHLALTGRLILEDMNNEMEKHTTFYIEFENGKHLRFIDQIKYGKVWHTSYEDCKKRLKHIGPEMWHISVVDLKQRIMQKKYENKTIKLLLLDQKFIAGIGNIYASEILFHCKTLPWTAVKGLTNTHHNDLYFFTCKVLLDAIANKGTTFSDYRTGTGGYGNNQHSLMVYSRDSCRVCGDKILNNKKDKPKDRTSYWCPTCQQ